MEEITSFPPSEWCDHLTFKNMNSNNLVIYQEVILENLVHFILSYPSANTQITYLIQYVALFNEIIRICQTSTEWLSYLVQRAVYECTILFSEFHRVLFECGQVFMKERQEAEPLILEGEFSSLLSVFKSTLERVKDFIPQVKSTKNGRELNSLPKLILKVEVLHDTVEEMAVEHNIIADENGEDVILQTLESIQLPEDLQHSNNLQEDDVNNDWQAISDSVLYYRTFDNAEANSYMHQQDELDYFDLDEEEDNMDHEFGDQFTVRFHEEEQQEDFDSVPSQWGTIVVDYANHTSK